MKFKLITDASELETVKDAWMKLYESIDDATSFQSYVWNEAWWSLGHHPSDRLFVIYFYEKDVSTAHAIFPFFIDKDKTLKFIASIHSDFSDFLIDAFAKQQLYKIFSTVHKIIDSNPDIDSIELNNLNQNNEYIGMFSLYFDYKKITYQSNAYSYKVLSPHQDFIDCFDYLKSKQRSELKRIYKKNKHFLSQRLHIENTRFPYENIKEIIHEMVDGGQRDQNFMNDSFLNIIRKLYEDGSLIINEIHDDTQTLSMNFILYNEKNNHYIFWIDIYKNVPKINLYSYLEYIRSLSQGCNSPFTIDFGRGLYNYKIMNFYPRIELQFTLFYSKKQAKFLKYLFKLSSKLIVKNFYKKNKTIINKLLRR